MLDQEYYSLLCYSIFVFISVILLSLQEHPGIFNLFRSDAIRNRVASDTEDYQQRNTRLASGEIVEQDSSMVNAYYNIVTDFYEYGWGQSFHFATTNKGETFDMAIARHENLLADTLKINSTMKVIDVGSGVGGPARNIHAHTKADITGVSINEYQINRANAHTKKIGMSDKVHFKQMDFTKLEFEDETFDGAYSIEATCHSTDLYDVYSEVFRVLKKGACFGSYEWLTTAKYDASNEEHRKILRDIEYGSGLPPVHNYKDVEIAAEKAGFKIVKEHDYALDVDYPEFDKVWYNKVDMSKVSTTITDAFTRVMEFFGLAAAGSVDAHTTLLHAIDGLVAGGKTGIFTPMHMVIMCKP